MAHLLQSWTSCRNEQLLHLIDGIAHSLVGEGGFGVFQETHGDIVTVYHPGHSSTTMSVANGQLHVLHALDPAAAGYEGLDQTDILLKAQTRFDTAFMATVRQQLNVHENLIG